MPKQLFGQTLDDNKEKEHRKYLGWAGRSSIVLLFSSFHPLVQPANFLLCQNIKDFLVHVQIMHYNVKVPRTFFFNYIFL